MEKHMKCGIIADNYGANQIGFTIINAANKFAKTNNNGCILFQLEYVPHCIKSDVCAMNYSEIYGYNACLISNSLESTKIMLSASNNGPMIFYIWDIFWLRRGSEVYDHNMAVLNNPNLLLVCRSESHRQMVENYTNRNPAIMPFDINALTEYGYKYGNFNRNIPEWISKIPGI